MADAVRSIVTLNQAPFYAVNLTCISDGSGESNVVKIDKSTLLAQTALEPTALDIMFCWGVAFGCSNVRLHWDHTTDDTALVVNGSFFFDYSHVKGLRDPKSAGGTGDILLTSTGMVASGGYCIDLMCQMRED